MNDKWAPMYYGTHTGVTGDIEFYLEALATPMKILELGCGTGRLTSELVTSGHQVVAVDQSVYAIRVIKGLIDDTGSDSDLVAIRGGFEDLPVIGPFDCVILSFNALLCLDSDGKALLLAAIRNLLQPGGLFLLDFYDGSGFIDFEQTDEEPWFYEPEYLRSIEHEGETFDVYQSGTFFPSESKIVMHYDHFLENCEDPDESRTYEITHHLVTLDQFRSLATDLGFGIDGIIEREFDGNTHLFCTITRTRD